MSNIIYLDDYKKEELVEPDWDKLKALLSEAEKWLNTEEGHDDYEQCPFVAYEAVGLCLTMLSQGDFENGNKLAKYFLLHVEWMAYWLQAMPEDEKLNERIKALCKDVIT